MQGMTESSVSINWHDAVLNGRKWLQSVYWAPGTWRRCLGSCVLFFFFFHLNGWQPSKELKSKPLKSLHLRYEFRVAWWIQEASGSLSHQKARATLACAQRAGVPLHLALGSWNEDDFCISPWMGSCLCLDCVTGRLGGLKYGGYSCQCWYPEL